jgi:hypothetical protein
MVSVCFTAHSSHSSLLLLFTHLLLLLSLLSLLLSLLACYLVIVGWLFAFYLLAGGIDRSIIHAVSSEDTSRFSPGSYSFYVVVLCRGTLCFRVDCRLLVDQDAALFATVAVLCTRSSTVNLRHRGQRRLIRRCHRGRKCLYSR